MPLLSAQTLRTEDIFRTLFAREGQCAAWGIERACSVCGAGALRDMAIFGGYAIVF